MIKTLLSLLILGVGILLQGCISDQPALASATQIPELVPSSTQFQTETPEPSLTITNAPTPTINPISTVEQTPTLQNSPISSPIGLTPHVNATNFVIDHQSIELFDQIPQEYILGASKLLWLHRHASVGANMRFGLDCLVNYFPDRPDPSRRPYSCDKDLQPAEIIFDQAYDSSNWIFEAHAEPNPNPGWYNKTTFFIERIDNLREDENYTFASYNMGYVEDPTIMDHFFTNTNPDDAFPGVWDLEDLESRHPDLTMIWWTIALARRTDAHILEFNDQMRAYTAANDKILMDIADIESHRPDGSPCTGIDTAENPTELTAICSDYADEVFAGHLNAQGRTRMAKAIWIMMALLAGWDGTPQ